MGKRSTQKMRINTVWHLAIVFIGCAIGVLHADEPTVVFQVNESPPYWSQKHSSGGLGSEILQAISKEIGLTTRIEFVPLRRLIADTSNNDVGNPLFYMDNQDFSAIIPIAISYSSFFYYHKDAKQISSNTQHQPMRIGSLSGTSGGQAGLRGFGKLEESHSKESLFKKLKAGRIDTAVELNLAGRETISKLFPNEIDHFNVHIIPESAAPIAIMIDTNYPNGATMGKRYQEGLHRILKNGVYQKILKKYSQNTAIPAHYYSDLSKFEALYSSDLGGNGL